MSLLSILISLIVYGLIFYILYWGLAKIALPEPFAKIALVILVIATMIVVIGLLTGYVHPLPIFSGDIRLK